MPTLTVTTRQRISREKHDIFIFIYWSFLIRHKDKINKTEGHMHILQKVSRVMVKIYNQ